MKKFRVIDTITGWAVFAIAAFTYLMTIEPSASFWDCGEFISTANKLQVGHPPGAPFFMLMGRIFAMFTSDSSHVAMMVNAFSALCSAFTILFLFWTITHLARKLVIKSDEDFSMASTIGILGAGVVGALAYTFSDTFWFSAVEGEVYAFSSLFTAVVFWAILKWEDSADDAHSTRWIVLIAYLMGLSIGVHLLNLLAIPAIVLVYYFKKNDDVNWKGFLGAVLTSFVILLFVQYGLIPGFTKVAGLFELFFVNTVGMSFNSGLAIYLILVAALFVWAIYESHVGKHPSRIKISFMLLMIMLGVPFLGSGIWLGLLIIVAASIFLFYKKDWNYRLFNIITLCTFVMAIGYSSYAMIMVRSSANPPMDQSSPEDVFALQEYLNREQYGYRPLFYGQTFSSPVDFVDEGTGRCSARLMYGSERYIREAKTSPNQKDKYLSIGKGVIGAEYVSQGKMLFPRMYSSQAHHVDSYKQWSNFTGKRIVVNQCGNRQEAIIPTMGENLKFFFSYQLNFMYWRYFMWNFSGRQNDIQCNNGELDAGNWISGIPFIDNALYGDQSKLPDYLKNNKGHNRYYMLPLLLGLLGIVWQLGKAKRGKRQFWLTFFLFFMTGIAIVLYLNQTPYQPRERDYAYAGSFYAFTIWIGLGVLFIADLFEKLKAPKLVATLVAFVVSLGVPMMMASENWDDHDRSDRYVCRDTGWNYLNSCQQNSVLFCNGDNDTFPLWYVQETEGNRTDIRTCNLSYLSADWYIDNMKRGYYDSAPLQIDLEQHEYQTNSLDWAVVQDHPMFGGVLEADKAFELLRDPQYQRDNSGYLFASTLAFPVDKQKVIAAGVVAPSDYENIVDTIYLKIDKQSIGKSDIFLLNLLKNNDWTRPIYFCTSIGNGFYPSSINEYLQMEGLAFRFVPVKKRQYPAADVMYDNMMNKFKYNLAGKNVYLDETNARACRTVRQSFGYLATALIDKGDSVRAKQALDRSLKEIPEATLEFDYQSMIPYVEVYFKAGDKAQAEYIMSKLTKQAEQTLNFIGSLPLSKQLFVSPEMSIRNNLGTLQHCAMLAKDNGSSKAAEYQSTFERYYGIFQSRLGLQ